MQNEYLKRTRNLEIVLYQENEKHIKILDQINKSEKCCYILHDKDLKEDSEELKKSHYHVLIERDNAITISALAKKYEIESNLIRKINNKEKAYQYLIHLNDDDKYKYETKEIKGNNKDKAVEIIEKKTIKEIDKLNELINFLEDNKNEIQNYRQFMKITISFLGTNIKKYQMMLIKYYEKEIETKKD